jgi:transmembrane sensor
VKLTIGDQYRGHEGQAVYEVVKVNPDTVLAWRNGRLIFENAPLSQVISDLNRHYLRKLVITDDATKELRFSGVLKLDDEATVVKRLEGLLPVAVQSQGDDLVLERRSSD